MTISRTVITIAVFLIFAGAIDLHAYNVIVADSATRMPLPNASIYDRLGVPVGISGQNGALPRIAPESYPITVRYLGFLDRTVPAPAPDTVFLHEDISELPEFVVETHKRRVLHMLAYVREYSTLTTYADTVFLFREKMVDYMLTPDSKVKFSGWSVPRVLTCRSYYRFTDSNGLDSVSDASPYHFSWSDWMGLAPPANLPAGLRRADSGTDTLQGKYSPAEIWTKNNGTVSVDIDVLADEAGRKWAPGLSGSFFKDMDFERFRLSYNYANIADSTVSPADLTRYSYDIESNGRGREMFRFNRRGEHIFVNTSAEVYILDKEYISVKEARKWDKRKFDIDEIGIYEPMEAQPLSPSVLALVDRVNRLDKDGDRLGYVPDHRLVSKYSCRNNFRIGRRALMMLKQMTGISRYKFNRNLGNRYKEFRSDWINRDRNGDSED